jgi:hypothetical protein
MSPVTLVIELVLAAMLAACLFYFWRLDRKLAALLVSPLPGYFTRARLRLSLSKTVFFRCVRECGTGPEKTA